MWVGTAIRDRGSAVPARLLSPVQEAHAKAEAARSGTRRPGEAVEPAAVTGFNMANAPAKRARLGRSLALLAGTGPGRDSVNRNRSGRFRSGIVTGSNGAAERLGSSLSGRIDLKGFSSGKRRVAEPGATTFNPEGSVAAARGIANQRDGCEFLLRMG